ncbi:unnamed protein product [Eruca vesicaria subsp. sativa]|uniref:Uncharacterized protein n=1 Tax=Eruca vesicaria subsp. sativa TaxID=29727 RepID=A0ABC8ILY2_ERUVS|nr:unnamed protein product [Eruca vesicaria subsp. sativa]
MNTAIPNGWRASVTSQGPRKFLSLLRSYPNAIPRSLDSNHLRSYGRRAMVISSSKKANLSAYRKQRIKLNSNEEKELTFSEFLKHPSGIEAVINAKALESYQLVDDDDNTYSTGFEGSFPHMKIVQLSCFPASGYDKLHDLEHGRSRAVLEVDVSFKEAKDYGLIDGVIMDPLKALQPLAAV